MASFAIQTRPAGVRTDLTLGTATLKRHVRVLLVSHPEVRQSLLRTLETLPADVIVCSTHGQAEEVLSGRVFEIAFCDEHLPDGSYSDLVHPNRCEHRIPRVVVVTRTGEWDLYLPAIGSGFLMSFAVLAMRQTSR